MTDPGALCRACGLCCDGTLFGLVRLLPGEAVALPQLAAADAATLPQPCPALQGVLCACYDVRPQSCRAFDCLLLRALREGEVTLAEAVETIAHARLRRGDDAWLDRMFRGRGAFRPSR